jgi:hypothetical protein
MMRRHELDPVSLTFGFAFTGLGLLFLVGRADQALRLHWIWPILLLVLGVGILADLARHRGSEGAPALDPLPEREPYPGLDADPEPERAVDPEPEEVPDLEPEEVPDLEPEEVPDLEPEGAVDNREHPI